MHETGELKEEVNEMSGDKNEVVFKSLMTMESAVGALKDLAENLKKGKVTISQGGGVMELAPTGDVLVKVKGTKEPHKEKLAFQIKWRKGGYTEPTEEITFS